MPRDADEADQPLLPRLDRRLQGTPGAERNVALQTIKSLARRRWDGREATAATWYEPLREQADIDLAVHWVLGRPDTFLLTTGDVGILPRLLDAAERFESRPSDEQMAVLAARQEATPLFV